MRSGFLSSLRIERRLPTAFVGFALSDCDALLALAVDVVNVFLHWVSEHQTPFFKLSNAAQMSFDAGLSCFWLEYFSRMPFATALT